MTQLERELRLSLQFVEMQQALREAIPLLRQRQQELGQTVLIADMDGKRSFATNATQSEHDVWLTALMHCESALKGASTPLVVVEEVWR